MPPLTLEQLKLLLSYDPLTGEFTRLVDVHRSKAGTIAGSFDAKGYVVIVIDKKPYKAHRLAWFYMTGEWPKGLIDHRNTIPMDNFWANLREATRAQNFANSGVSRANKSGFKGVHWAKHMNKWCASIRADGKRKVLGFFDDVKEAAEIYGLASTLIHGDFSHV